MVVSAFGRPLDTSDDASARQVERWRAMTAREKAELVAGLYRAAIQMVDAGIAARYPEASPRERFLRRAILTLGRELAISAYPDAAVLTD
jgi:hypothetical protein